MRVSRSSSLVTATVNDDLCDPHTGEIWGPWNHSSYSSLINLDSLRSDIVKVPNWRHLCSKGGDASTTPYTGKFWTQKVNSQARGKPWFWTNGVSQGMKATVTGVYPSVPIRLDASFPWAELESLEAQAKKRFLTALRKKRSEMSGPTFLGELRETVGLIRRPASSLLKGLDGYLWNVYKYGRGLRPGLSLTRRVRAISRVASDLWLEASFGWRPLIADTISIAESIARFQNDRFSPIVRGFAGRELSEFGSDATPTDISTILNLVRHWQTKRNIGTVFYGRLNANAQLPQKGSAARLLQILGFNLEEFLPTVWELIPFSFVIDYFTNVGDLIAADSTDLSSLGWANQVLWSRIETRRYGKISAAQPQFIAQVGDLTFGSVTDGLYEVIRRPVQGDFAWLPLQFNLPGSANQWANLAALLVGRATNFKP